VNRITGANPSIAMWVLEGQDEIRKVVPPKVNPRSRAGLPHQERYSTSVRTRIRDGTMESLRRLGAYQYTGFSRDVRMQMGCA
jgi:hypothetical protein